MLECWGVLRSTRFYGNSQYSGPAIPEYAKSRSRPSGEWSALRGAVLELDRPPQGKARRRLLARLQRSDPVTDELHAGLIDDVRADLRHSIFVVERLHAGDEHRFRWLAGREQGVRGKPGPSLHRRRVAGAGVG